MKRGFVHTPHSNKRWGARSLYIWLDDEYGVWIEIGRGPSTVGRYFDRRDIWRIIWALLRAKFAR